MKNVRIIKGLCWFGYIASWVCLWWSVDLFDTTPKIFGIISVGLSVLFIQLFGVQIHKEM